MNDQRGTLRGTRLSPLKWVGVLSLFLLAGCYRASVISADASDHRAVDSGRATGSLHVTVYDRATHHSDEVNVTLADDLDCASFNPWIPALPTTAADEPIQKTRASSTGRQLAFTEVATDQTYAVVAVARSEGYAISAGCVEGIVLPGQGEAVEIEVELTDVPFGTPPPIRPILHTLLISTELTEALHFASTASLLGDLADNIYDPIDHVVMHSLLQSTARGEKWANLLNTLSTAELVAEIFSCYPHLSRVKLEQVSKELDT